MIISFLGFLRELPVSELIHDDGVLSLSDNQGALVDARGTNSPKTEHIHIAHQYV